MFFIPYGTQETEARRAFPIITVLIVLANVLVFLLEAYVLYGLGESGYNNIINQFAFVPQTLKDNPLQITLLTSLFLHAGLLHIIGNMLYLLPFGDNVEDKLGHFRYLVFYIVCGVAASLIFALFNLSSAVPLVGASGAIAGVLGGYIALFPRKSSVKGLLWVIIVIFPVQLPAILFIGYWFIGQLFSSFATLGSETINAGSGGVAFLAHVGGFITGLILAPLLAKKTSTIPR